MGALPGLRCNFKFKSVWKEINIAEIFTAHWMVIFAYRSFKFGVVWGFLPLGSILQIVEDFLLWTEYVTRYWITVILIPRNIQVSKWELCRAHVKKRQIMKIMKYEQTMHPKLKKTIFVNNELQTEQFGLNCPGLRWLNIVTRSEV